MRQVVKRRISTPNKVLITMAGVVVLLTVLCIVLANIDFSSGEGNKNELTEIYDFESYYLNSPITYPQLEETDITYLLIKNEHGTFDMTRWPDATGAMWIGYDNGDGVLNMHEYIPPIVATENEFDYESLYAVENNDGYGRIYKLTYLMVALGTTYFEERIELPEPTTPELKAERDALLKQYGVDTAGATTIAFEYTDRDSKGNIIDQGSRRILVGKRPVSGNGYYFMVEDKNERNFVYYTSNNYFNYALMGVESFIKGMLVAEGLESDQTFEPYLTTDFKEWVNTRHKQEGERVAENSTVLAGGISLIPINAGKDYVIPEGAPKDGYTHGDYTTLSFDLSSLKAHPDYARIKSYLTSLSVGVYYDYKSDSATAQDKVLLTLFNELHESESKLIDLSAGDKVTYSYSVGLIESVITDTAELTALGTPVGDARFIKVSYYYKVNGENASSIARHAVIDLEDTGIPESARLALKAESVGELATAVAFDIEYTKENSLSNLQRTVISDIAGIFDQSGYQASKIAADSYVSLRYYVENNGVKGEKQALTIRLSDIKDTDVWAPLKTLLLGKSAGANLEIEVSSKTTYYEYFKDFITYEIWDVESFITSEMVASFRFVNASERDPFYGESYYENTIGNSYKLYGLNAGSCEQVVKILGGIGNTSNSETVGFSGTTVALGLNHETMEKYGLYAYRIYFELPRGLYDKSEGTEADDEDVLSDFGWYDTLGFNLYISEEDPVTGNRYVGSDVFDLVAEVPGDQLEFLKFGFVEFWARRNLMLTKVTNLEKFRVELEMEDVYGDYLFEVDVRDVYIGYINGESVVTYDKSVFDAAGVTPTKAEQLVNFVTQQGDCINTKLSEYLQIHSDVLTDGKVKLSSLYNYYINLEQGTDGTHFYPGTVDSMGDSNFKEMFELLQLTTYDGTLTEEEQLIAKSSPRVMRLHVKLSSSGFYYTYDFYRFSDRKVMVCVYRSDENGELATGAPVSDFYVSTFAFKKLVGSVIDLLNVETVDGEVPYT